MFGDANIESSSIPVAGNGMVAIRVGNGRREADVDGRGEARIVGVLMALKHSRAQGSPKPKHGSFSSQAIFWPIARLETCLFILCAREGLDIKLVVRWLLGILSLISDVLEPERNILGPVSESSAKSKGVSSDKYTPSRSKRRCPFGILSSVLVRYSSWWLWSQPTTWEGVK